MRDDFRGWPLCPLMSCCVTDVCRPGDFRFARSAPFESALNRRAIKAVMNVSISLVPLLTSFQCLRAERLFCERFRIGGLRGRSNGFWPKRSAIDVLNVDSSCIEGPNSVATASQRWRWIDPGGCGHTNPHRAGPNQSLQRTWLSRILQGALFVCRSSGSCWVRRFSRHAAELRSVSAHTTNAKGCPAAKRRITDAQ